MLIRKAGKTLKQNALSPHIPYMRIQYLTTALLLTALLPNCTSVKTGIDTVYEGAAMGYRGMIQVRVGMEKGIITEIAVTESREDTAVGGAAIEELTDLVLMYNSTEFDEVSGATETSKGFLAAIENAIIGP
jgi:uncharacterized protein with FMN-binding domain